MGLAIVTRIPSLAEAHIAAGALRSAGIAAEVFDSNFGGVESPVIESLGGYRIMAPEDQAIDARQILRELRGSPGLGEPDEVGPWLASLRPSPRSSAMRRLVAVGVVLAAAAWLILWLSR